VKEAVAYTDQALQNTKQQGLTELRVIVGKGLHSAGGNAKIKPAIEDLMRKHNLRAELDARNAGVLIVQIGHTNKGGLPPDELVRRLDQKDDECVVM
jgi:hypothetical protein